MKKLMMAVMIAGMAAGALADVSFSYSGQLRNETGGKVTAKNPKITFSLYNVATGGAALWSRMIPVLLDDNGYFAVELSNANGSAVGAETKLETVIADNATLYVGLNVENSSGEISPRQKLLSTPRAAFAEDVQTAKQGFTVNGSAVFVNGLTIGSGTSAKAEITSDGKIVAKELTVTTINNDTSVGGTLSAATLNATTVKQGGNVLIPKGVVVMWAGTQASVPDGWHLCDGEAGTPDLRGRFIVGSGKSSDGDTDYSFKNTGGKEKVSLTADEMPGHRHFYVVQGYSALRDSQTNAGVPLGETYYKQYMYNINDAGIKTTYTSGMEDKGVLQSDKTSVLAAVGTSQTGSSTSHENRPPYYALAFIMKL